MATKAAYKRVRLLLLLLLHLIHSHPHQLSKEYITMQREPPPFVWAAPEEKDILNCAPIHSYVMYFIAHSLFTSTGNFIIVRALKTGNTPRVADTLNLLS